MAAPNAIYTPIGARNCRIYALDTATGIIAPGVASQTAYDGIWASGLKGLELNTPEPQQIYHTGDDGVFAVDSLPATEAITGTLTTGKINLTLHTSLTGDKVITADEKKWRLMGSNNQGNEVVVAMLVYQQAVDTTPGSATYGARRWSWMLLPKALLIPLEAPFGGTEFVQSYSIRPQFVNSYPWGEVFTVADEGATRAQGIRGVSEYKPILNAWTGDNTLTEFNFSTGYPAAAATKCSTYIWVKSTGIGAIDSSATETTTKTTPSAKPAAGDVVIEFYEHNSAES
jgi:hypothetical protein